MDTLMAPQPSPSAVPAESRYVTVAEFADYWGVSERTVWRDIKKGAIVVERIGSARRVRIRRSTMKAYGKPQH